ncbi:sodium/proline symporter PutP [Chengkuizengella sp. 2205SS18-9]|uniref:Sodium/proline symporter n=1 Tax=Chengkuizengella axinellae TaxID=3064388 RepID=A0ABT9IY73_9BACL|nr:sodium/proline symporter PutP [Chengkuizengella sp. 2205SS18-9]MDP5274280.1 sodium/proline symporter PutP [Chengkuizengella sp. 2205SS18-9]
MSSATLTTFIIYLIGMLIIGWSAYKKTTDLSDYVLGGRRLGGGVAALSAGASDMSGWLLLGLPGYAYAAGMQATWICVGLAIGAYLNWQFVAKRLRVYTEVANDSITIPDFFENRFNDSSKLLRIISAFVILLFFTFYTSSGLVGGALLFENTFGLEYQLALWIGAAVIISYTLLGGFLAVSWTDFFQGILMFLALAVVPVVMILEMGGWNETVQRIGELDAEKLDVFSGIGFLGIISLMAWGLGYFGQPHILARFMSVKNHREIPKARFIGMSWMVVSLFGAIFTGFVGIAYFTGTPLVDSETVFIEAANVLFHPVVSGFLLAAILSAIMSTIDSQLLVSSSAIAEDFYKVLIRPSASSKELIWVGRISVLIIALIAIFLAFDPESSVLDLVSYAWAGFGAAFGPIIILSLFWKRMTRNGALSGMIVGAATVVIWKMLSTPKLNDAGVVIQEATIPFDLYEIVPGFIFGFFAIVIVSLIGKAPDSSIASNFNKMEKMLRSK